MAVQGVARRYAEAVYELAAETGTEESWLTALQTLADATRDDETRAYFENPAISEDAKVAALRGILTGPGSQEAINLSRLLIRRRRFRQIPGIREAFEEMVLRERGMAIADVTTALPMSDEDRRHVSRQLARIVGSDVEVRAHVDDAIVGGIVARVGDQLIDGSVRTQLRELRASLARR